MKLLSAITNAMNWWVSGLADPALWGRQSKKPWKGLIHRSDKGFDVYLRQGRGAKLIGTFDQSTPVEQPSEILTQLARSRIAPNSLVLRLSPSEVLHSRLTLPQAVRDVIDHVLRNQLERLSPWSPREAVYAYKFEDDADDSDKLSVDLWVTGRDRFENLLADLAARGFAPGVVDCGDAVEAEVEFNLINNIANEKLRLRRAVYRVGIVSACAVLLAGAVLAWMVSSLYFQRGELEKEIGRLANSTVAISAPKQAQARRAQDSVVRERSRLPAQSLILDALSRALPDDAYLDRLEIRKQFVTLHGYASNVPALIDILEKTQKFEDVKFTSPITWREGEARYRFAISASVKPETKLIPGGTQ